MSHGLSDAMEGCIREYSKYLLEISKCKIPAELEYMEAEMQNYFSNHERDIRKTEAPTLMLLRFLTENHFKSCVIGIGIDPHTMAPIVRLDDDMMF